MHESPEPHTGLSPLDNGLWFIADAACALAEQEGMGSTGRSDLARRMGECASLPAEHPEHLSTRHLDSRLPIPQGDTKVLAVGVYPSDVNAWLEACGVAYRWAATPVWVTVPALVSAIPPVLSAVKSEEVVCFEEDVAGRTMRGHLTAGDLLELLQEKASRQARGWLELEEAAQILQDAGRGQAGGWQEKFVRAAQSGVMPMHEPGSLERVVYNFVSRREGLRHVRTGHEWVHIDDLNRWLDTHEPRLPFRFEFPRVPTPPEVQPTQRDITYSLPQYPRLEPRSQWTISRLGEMDYIGLEEASKLATRHAGSEVTVSDFLRAGARGELPIFAKSHREATMLPTSIDGAPLDVPMGSFPTLPLAACRVLGLYGQAEWRTYEHLTPRDEFGGELGRYVRWELPPEEPSFVTITADCFVLGRDVHALGDASMATQGVQQASTAQARAVSRHSAQEAAILTKLSELGFNPLALPIPAAGKSSDAKQAVKKSLGYSEDVLKKAWQRLRSDGRIQDE